MRIAAYADIKNPSSYYRAIEPMNVLAAQGNPVRIKGAGTELVPEMLGFDVVLISRWVGPGTVRLVQQLRSAGLGVVWDLDDGVTFTPELAPTALENQRRRKMVATMARLADVVTTTNGLLADHLRSIGATTVRVIENYLGDHFAGLRREPHDGLVLGWAAWLDHQADWQQLKLQETIDRLLDAHPGLRVESVGLVSLNLPAERYRQTHAVPIEELGRQLTRFDIGIAPIADNAFNRVRSNIKLKEYAGAGVPWLASPIGPYAGLGEKQGGRLVADDRWLESLDELIRNPRLLRKLAKRARSWGERQLVADNVAPWEAALAEAMDRAQARAA